MKQGKPTLVAVVMLVGTWSLLQSLSHGEPVLIKRPFSEFPLNIADRWEGREMGMEQRYVDLLGVTDYMNRIYQPHTAIAQGVPVEVSFYVGYYQSQRTGATYHSPKNCLPGSGWRFEESDYVTVPVGENSEVTVNKVIIQKDMSRVAVLYWYHDRGRVVANEYTAKAYFLWDAMTKNRTDGALVRIAVPVLTTTEAAHDEAVQFLRAIWDPLNAYMPSVDHAAVPEST